MRLISINTPLVLSLAIIVVAAITVAVQLPPLLEALSSPRPGDDPTQARLNEYLASHEEDLDAYRDRVDGRSLFYMPQPPRRKPPPPPPPPPANDGDAPPPPPPPPRSYEGPSVLFVLGDEVWFHDGVRVRVGEEGSNGVTVISSDPPWEVKLGYGGGEFSIVLFDRAHPGLAEKPRTQASMPGLVPVERDNVPTKEPAGQSAEARTP